MKKRKRHSPEQIVKKLRDADAMLAAGKKRAELFAYLIEQFQNDKALPATNYDVLAECQSLLQALRWSKPQTARGPVRFELA